METSWPGSAGDEFVVQCRSITQANAERLAERLVQCLDEEFVVGDRRHRLGASAGVAVGGPRTRHRTLLSRADAALYRAKRGGGRQVNTGPTVSPSERAGRASSTIVPAEPPP